jgi:hypothetical protein
MSRIAAVIPTLGASPVRDQCLAALRREQAAGVDLEILLVGPAEAIGGADRAVVTAGRLGFAAACNRGIAVTTGPWVALINDDAVIEPGWCQVLQQALEGRPSAAAVQGVNLTWEEPPRADGWGIGWRTGWQAVQLGRGGAPLEPAAPPREVFGVSATAALYRRRHLEELEPPGRAVPGPFDERLGSYYEDVDLAVRLRSRGRDAVIVPRARVRHLGSATAGAGPRRWARVYGNRYLVLARLFGRRAAPVLARAGLRDLRDAARAAAGLDGRRLAGITAGWLRAVALLPAFLHRGLPLVPAAELERFRVSS